MKNKYLQDNSGNKSSLRVMLLFIIVVISLCLLCLLFVFVKESYKEVPDYSGLASMAAVLLGGDLLALVAKVWQKKFEL